MHYIGSSFDNNISTVPIDKAGFVGAIVIFTFRDGTGPYANRSTIEIWNYNDGNPIIESVAYVDDIQVTPVIEKWFDVFEMFFDHWNRGGH